MMNYKQKYTDLLEITAAIARQAAPEYLLKIAETEQEASSIGVRIGDTYRVYKPMKFIPNLNH